MKLLDLLESIIREDDGSINVRMFALFAHVFDELFKGLQKGEMDDTYEYLKKYYRGQNRIALEYFYEYLKKNKDKFVQKDKTITEDYKKTLLHNYWDKKGLESNPIYHYLGLNPRDKEDRKKIFYYKLDYLGGIESAAKKFESEVLTGKPVTIHCGGYTIEYLVTSVDVDAIEPDSYPFGESDGEIYYEINGLINGDTSYVTLMTDGETYNIGDVANGTSNMDNDVAEEVGYEIGDCIRDYFDKIGEKYAMLGDSTDYHVVSGEKFKQSFD